MDDEEFRDKMADMLRDLAQLAQIHGNAALTSALRLLARAVEEGNEQDLARACAGGLDIKMRLHMYQMRSQSGFLN